LLKKLILVLLCWNLAGCAGLADYEINLDNGYRIDRLSAHVIAIYGDKPIKSDDKSFHNHLYVPAKVTDVWWNKEYIVAKQIVLVADERGYEQPPEKPSLDDFQYWLIDVRNHQVLGPLTEKELESETNKLGLTEKIALTPINKLKRMQ
jgi:hypothetical protein